MSRLRIAVDPATRVAVLTMDDGGQNRFHPDLLTEMLDALDALEADAVARAIVLTGGHPKYFCTGLDLAWLAAHIAEDEVVRDYLRLVNRVLRRWTLFPKPTVGALSGHTFAAGFFLAAHLDFRFMRADRGWVCLPAIDLDLPVPPGMIAITRSILAPEALARVLYTGRRFSPAEAVALGFVQETFPKDELLPRCTAFAAELARKSTRTYGEMKRRLRAPVVRIMDEDDPAGFVETLRLVRQSRAARSAP